MKAEQIKAGLMAPKMAGFSDLSAADQTQICVSELLYDAAEKTGGFQSWTMAWLRLCEATGRHPLTRPGELLKYADIDRYCGNVLGEHEKEMEMRAFIRQQQGGGNG